MNPYNGVYNFIKNHYPEVFVGIPEYPEKRPHKVVVNEIMIEFIREILEVPFMEGTSKSDLEFNSQIIQDNWQDFKSFMDPEINY